MAVSSVTAFEVNQPATTPFLSNSFVFVLESLIRGGRFRPNADSKKNVGVIPFIPTKASFWVETISTLHNY